MNSANTLIKPAALGVARPASSIRRSGVSEGETAAAATASGVVGPEPPAAVGLLAKARRSLNRTTPPGFAAWCVAVTTVGAGPRTDRASPCPAVAEVVVVHDDKMGLADGEEDGDGAEDAEVED